MPEHAQRMRFIGVSTAHSSIVPVFPRWAKLLGLDAELVGLNVPLDADPALYRQVVAELKQDPSCVGALVTTHKIGLFEAAEDMFDSLDEFALACREVSSLSLCEGRLHGAAKDPLTAGLSIEEFLPEDHFASGAEVVCLGAGGAGTAIAWYLTTRAVPPAMMHFVDTDAQRLASLRAVLAGRLGTVRLETHLAQDIDLETGLPQMPRGTVVINATGMGKDRPGSPLPDDALLPSHGVIWELNYRGSLEFLEQARTQAAERRLTVVDGWRYFIHGWSQVIAEVFDVALTREIVDRLSAEAAAVR